MIFYEYKDRRKLTAGNFISKGFALWFFVSNWFQFQWLKLSRNSMQEIFIATGLVTLKNVTVNHGVNCCQFTTECCHVTLSLWKSRSLLEENTSRGNIKHVLIYLDWFFGSFLFGMFSLPIRLILVVLLVVCC